MHIYVDADALPGAIKDILLRAAMRLRIGLTLVANKTLQIPQSQYVATIRVGQGFDVVDAAIVERVRPGDLVVTADIPLAALVVAKDAHALNPRGELYDKDNIQGRLAVRNLLSELRGAGVSTGGPAPLNNRDREAFANRLNIFLSGRDKQ
ncbi:MAG: YaiI/YqxD family protein [Desulfovibrionaceae bacterium]|nr:YaiI/YqxD family protein [Desulfovibrionaceae bacterium]MBF0513772.1 YaiI/YqxD family protein [Desulfovibrionaceae bacterium]